MIQCGWAAACVLTVSFARASVGTSRPGNPTTVGVEAPESQEDDSGRDSEMEEALKTRLANFTTVQPIPERKCSLHQWSSNVCFETSRPGRMWLSTELCLSSNHETQKNRPWG
ncbi:uncharacterized protein ACOB8E_006490 [Sarcophilus harrisii]